MNAVLRMVGVVRSVTTLLVATIAAVRMATDWMMMEPRAMVLR